MRITRIEASRRRMWASRRKRKRSPWAALQYPGTPSKTLPPRITHSVRTWILASAQGRYSPSSQAHADEPAIDPLPNLTMLRRGRAPGVLREAYESPRPLANEHARSLARPGRRFILTAWQVLGSAKKPREARNRVAMTPSTAPDPPLIGTAVPATVSAVSAGGLASRASVPLRGGQVGPGSRL